MLVTSIVLFSMVVWFYIHNENQMVCCIGVFFSRFKNIYSQPVTLVSFQWVIAHPLRQRLAPVWERSEKTAWCLEGYECSHYILLHYCTPVSYLSCVNLQLETGLQSPNLL